VYRKIKKRKRENQMRRNPHPNAKWLGPSEAARFAGCHRDTIWKYAQQGLIRVRLNPLRKGQNAKQYHKADIELNILGYKAN
jgi:hypothetical protein